MHLNLTQLILLSVSVFLTVHGTITLIWMLYAWENPKSIKLRKAPKKYLSERYSFTAIVPVRHEETVIEDTIRAINSINYPDGLKEILIVVRHDDKETIQKAHKITTRLGNENIKVVVLVDSHPINKPISLNFGLKHARNQIITIFDAEDEPYLDIYNIVNTVMQKSKVDVVQSGVQLMNYDSYWFSPLNIMEYYLWFKSGLNFFTDHGRTTLLGGNSVFIKKEFLNKINGWDETCLTEDADIAIRLSLAGAKIKIIYDEKSVTREETPNSVESFVRQRTRWNQGFLQILAKGDWLKLPLIRQKLVTFYMLFAPFIPLLFFFYIPFGLWTTLIQQTPIVTAIITYVPFYILCAIILVQIVGLREFTKTYNYKFYWYLPVKVIASYFPYMALLVFSAGRSLVRFLISSNSWEKTTHLNIHRKNSLLERN
ncbi:hypothetical protein A2962_05315 [Candidatus Woesebacteria bacterium RIFCSPLOWO2_01_FULL_39_61]|uniref:Glycosyltransferase 2-like domain-containing protein n=1 Tax=Candidatus Woesebacteria bacterium RIFCSPHIGHO2_02_FULL_39_13 TaxID=1802505 RepID=A0A1F7Z0J1_9BACT|nr:MAG: hypothetical protein A2692_03580 [Candidatus Woesebacteria bacterium RIFCSPHIGHO2_01_FULL_39_95]OGM33081.1 MAG: hypothetical protein A3D01_06615 [Candidatus Woesebacteria bacterium RIFCSPHIGHO2_02_FULL_39_13]OGM66553.1 MAG: hypothetical protein A2962_05315 [Candidatus Woesebacteria bacterium RIFCSPLOWO2_01_FULL_39_61]OGM74311.1 MAG: hypothetical protein A3H19_06025 [Candidatus Woesebacteria bacterium RIFCSPLOWO2_12_FULL_39_9]